MHVREGIESKRCRQEFWRGINFDVSPSMSLTYSFCILIIRYATRAYNKWLRKRIFTFASFATTHAWLGATAARAFALFLPLFLRNNAYTHYNLLSPVKVEIRSAVNYIYTQHFAVSLRESNETVPASSVACRNDELYKTDASVIMPCLNIR